MITSLLLKKNVGPRYQTIFQMWPAVKKSRRPWYINSWYLKTRIGLFFIMTPVLGFNIFSQWFMFFRFINLCVCHYNFEQKVCSNADVVSLSSHFSKFNVQYGIMTKNSDKMKKLSKHKLYKISFFYLHYSERNILRPGVLT